MANLERRRLHLYLDFEVEPNVSDETIADEFHKHLMTVQFGPDPKVNTLVRIAILGVSRLL